MSCSRFPVLTSAIVAVAAGLWSACAVAVQERQSVARKAETASDSNPRPDDEPAPPEGKRPAAKPAATSPTVRVKGPDGKPVEIPKDAWDDFLAWLKLRNGQAYAVNSVAVDGTADDKQANLTVTISLQILRDGEWMRIPIFLNEGQLTATRHTFLGESPDAGDKVRGEKGSAAFADVTQEAGYRWWFKGKGEHRLRLSLVAPVTKSVAQRRLRLKLPPLAAASTATLRVGSPNLIVAPLRVGIKREKRVGKSATEVQITGLGSELDVQWRTAAGTRGLEPIVQAQTSIVVDFIDESVVLAALQRVRVLNGSLSRVEIQLPAGYQVLAATGKFVNSYRVNGRNQATVEFTELRSEWTEINWTLRRTFPVNGGNLTLQGFEVARAQVHSGDVAIARVQGLRVEHQEADNLAVLRIRAADFAAPDLIRNKTLSSAYRFVSQPYRLNLRVSRVQPQVTVEPTIRLTVSEKKLVLYATFQVDVSEEGATVRDLEIHWPGWHSAGWNIQPLTSPTLIERRTVNPGNDGAPIRVRLIGRKGGTFVIPLVAERTIAPAKTGIPLRLPVLTATASRQGTTRPTLLVVAREPNVTLDLTDHDEQPLPEIADGPAEGLSRRYQISDPAAAPLTARVTVHAQRLQADSTVELAATASGVNVRQRIVLQADYVPVTAVRLEVPSPPGGRESRFEIFNAQGRRLTTTPAIAKSGQGAVDVKLERPMLGKIELLAVAIVDSPTSLTPGETATLNVPLVRIDGVKYSQVRVQAPADSKLEVTLPDKGWRRNATLDGSSAWSSDSSPAAVRCRVTSPALPRGRPFSISRALIRVSVDSAGTARYRAQYRIAGQPDVVSIVLPSNAGVDAVWWGGKRANAAMQGGALRISVPAGQGIQLPLLSIDYHTSESASPQWLAAHGLVAPEFAHNVWIEETAWQVILPHDRHLSSFDASFTPEFTWSRSSAVWSRVPNAEFENPDRWIRAAEGPQWSAPEGNSYVFRRYGPPVEFEVQSMSRSLIVLVGAGLAWLIGMLLIRLPKLRTLAVLLTAALGSAVAGLWFLTELQLLLQPALLGGALAAGMAGIDRMTRRRTAPASLTVAHPSDFVIGSRSDSGPRPRSAPGVGSEDPTSVRPPAPTLEPISTATEARRQG